MILSNKRITKALIRLTNAQAGLHLCCMQTPEDRFSRAKAQMTLSFHIGTKYDFQKITNVLVRITLQI